MQPTKSSSNKSEIVELLEEKYLECFDHSSLIPYIFPENSSFIFISRRARFQMSQSITTLGGVDKARNERKSSAVLAAEKIRWFSEVCA